MSITPRQRLLGGMAPPLLAVHVLLSGMAPFDAAVLPPEVVIADNVRADLIALRITNDDLLLLLAADAAGRYYSRKQGP